MGKEYRAKSFKSGNSVAIRMPAALGIEPDREWTVTDEDGKLTIKPIARTTAKIDVSSFWGKAAPMVHVPSPREDFDPRPSETKS